MNADRLRFERRLTAVRNRMDAACVDKLEGKIMEDFWNGNTLPSTWEKRASSVIYLVKVVSVGMRSELRWNRCAARLALSMPRRSNAACSFFGETTVSGESSCRCLRAGENEVPELRS